MTREQMIVKISLEIGTQAVESDNFHTDLSWLDVSKLLKEIEKDMTPHQGKWSTEE